MKTIIIVLVLMFSLVVNVYAERIKLEEQQTRGFLNGTIFILADTKTGIQYLVYKNGNGLAMVKLEAK
jgi:hypothetical protein